MKHTLFIRADGNEKIGLGHIMRSMTIATSFRNVGFECIYICSAPINKKIFQRYKFSVIEIEYPYSTKTNKEAQNICSLIHERCAEYILVDSYYTNNEYLSILKKCTKLICINSTKKKLITDYLINENIACDRAYLKKLYLGTGTKLLLGPEYSPIRKEFCNRSYKVKKKVSKILITTGGGDQYNFMTQFLKEIMRNIKYCDLEFVFISGGCNIYYDLLLYEAKGKENIKIINNANNMAELMQDSDMAISAGGTTILELSVIGVPTIGIAVADDQEEGLNFMHHAGMICYAGRITETHFWKNVFLYFDNILMSMDLRAKLSGISKKHLDGKGADRICYQIINK